jgi:hypothetical protein
MVSSVIINVLEIILALCWIFLTVGLYQIIGSKKEDK